MGRAGGDLSVRLESDPKTPGLPRNRLREEVTLRTRPISVAALLVTLALPAAAPAAELDAHLAPLRPMVGKTWRGVFPKSTPEKPVVDISRFEAALNGQAVRNLHSINDGEYGGESLMIWDKEKQATSRPAASTPPAPSIRRRAVSRPTRSSRATETASPRCARRSAFSRMEGSTSTRST